VILFLFFSLSFQKEAPEPIHVKLGDPILPIQIEDSQNNSYRLEDTLSDGFCIFLSTTCGMCTEALPVIEKLLAQNYPCTLLITQNANKELGEDFLRLAKHPKVQVFFVKPEFLKQFNIKKLPAVLGYLENQLVQAYHGPINHENAERMLRIMEARR